MAASPLTARINASKHWYIVFEVQMLVGKQEETTDVAWFSSYSQIYCCCCVRPLIAHNLFTMFEIHRGEWEKIGTVVGGPEDTVAAGNQFHQGQQYDFVFDVDVADGVPPLKLPVNKGDNPYVAADK